MSKDTPRPLPQDEIERTSDFRAAELSGRDFSKIGLSQRDFRRAVLRAAKFIGCDLQGANFADAELSGANFKDANLQDVDFSNANLTKVNFYKANLVGAAFLGSNLFSTNFREARMGQTVFSNTDMETCVGLDSVVHEAPSSIAVDCLFHSGHNLPLSFLAGAGMPKLLLDYVPELVQATTPIQFHSCFISYSHPSVHPLGLRQPPTRRMHGWEMGHCLPLLAEHARKNTRRPPSAYGGTAGCRGET